MAGLLYFTRVFQRRRGPRPSGQLLLPLCSNASFSRQGEGDRDVSIGPPWRFKANLLSLLGLGYKAKCSWYASLMLRTWPSCGNRSGLDREYWDRECP